MSTSDISIPAALFLGFVIVQRLAELFLAKRNSARLLERGAIEHGASHYPVMVMLHTCWVLTLVFFGISQPVSLWWILIFAGLQVLRIWILVTLGERWTTRIIVLDEPLVLTGPFKWFRHPNYMLVVAEIIVAPMVLGLMWVAAVFTILNAAMLFWRIRIEEQALRPLRPS